MADNRTLDGDYWGAGKIQPGTGGEIRVTGPAKTDPFGHKIATGDKVVPAGPPAGAVGLGIAPIDKTTARGRW